jgi:serine/threonine-protein kinase
MRGDRMSDPPPSATPESTPRVDQSSVEQEVRAREIAEKLQGSSIMEILRVQEHLQKLVRDRHERQVAILFSDIADSARYFERHGDAEGRRMVQRHADLLAPIIREGGGRVVKNIGDAIMACFPTCQQAVETAARMQQALRSSNLMLTREEDRLEIRVGINFGSALANDDNDDLYGESVNVAARVQAQAARGQILIAEQVRELLSPAVPVRPAGEVELKWRSAQIGLHEVLWEKMAQPEGAVLEKPRLDPRYVVVKLLGSGGMAAVWRVRDERLGRDVAMKVLHRHLPFSSSMRERLEREAKVAASLTHENLVQVYDYSVQQGTDSYIAMELVDGTTLRELILQRKKLPWVVVALAAYEICRGLACAHENGVVHRDMKPDNVMVSRTGTLKIGDFGIARAREHSKMTAVGAPVGTPAYLSPEQVRGEPADARSDIFALGITLYEMVCGAPPFAAETSAGMMYQIVEGKFPAPERLAPEIDPVLAGLIRRCLSPSPAQRPTAAQVRDEVGLMLQRRRILDPREALSRYFVSGALPALQPSHGSRWGARRLALGAGVAAALAAAAALILRAAPVPPPPPPAGTVEIAAPPAPPRPAPAPAVAEAPAPVGPDVQPAEDPEDPENPMDPMDPRSSSAALKPGAIELTVRQGWADVRVDGKLIGRTPEVRTLTLPPGTYLLELTNPRRSPHRVSLKVEPGVTREYVVDLAPLP